MSSGSTEACLLGLLAAFAVPRLARVNADARVATMRALADGLQRSSAMVHELAEAQGLARATGSVSLHGATVSHVNGYPAASVAGIEAAVVNLQGFRVTHDGAVSRFSPASLPANTRCVLTYTASTGTVNPAALTVEDCR